MKRKKPDVEPYTGWLTSISDSSNCAFSKDFFLEAEGGVLMSCHSFLVFASSPVLRGLLDCENCTEKGPPFRLAVPDVSEKVLRIFFQYLYTGNVENSVFKADFSLFVDLAMLAFKWQVTALLELLCSCVVPDVSKYAHDKGSCVESNSLDIILYGCSLVEFVFDATCGDVPPLFNEFFEMMAVLFSSTDFSGIGCSPIRSLHICQKWVPETNLLEWGQNVVICICRLPKKVVEDHLTETRQVVKYSLWVLMKKMCLKRISSVSFLLAASGVYNHWEFNNILTVFGVCLGIQHILPKSIDTYPQETQDSEKTTNLVLEKNISDYFFGVVGEKSVIKLDLSEIFSFHVRISVVNVFKQTETFLYNNPIHMSGIDEPSIVVMGGNCKEEEKISWTQSSANCKWVDTGQYLEGDGVFVLDLSVVGPRTKYPLALGARLSCPFHTSKEDVLNYCRAANYTKYFPFYRKENNQYKGTVVSIEKKDVHPGIAMISFEDGDNGWVPIIYEMVAVIPDVLEISRKSVRVTKLR